MTPFKIFISHMLANINVVLCFMAWWCSHCLGIKKTQAHKASKAVFKIPETVYFFASDALEADYCFTHCVTLLKFGVNSIIFHIVLKECNAIFCRCMCGQNRHVPNLTLNVSVIYVTRVLNTGLNLLQCVTKDIQNWNITCAVH